MKKNDNSSSHIRKTTKAENEELMNIMREIAQKEREAQQAEYQRIINEPDAGYTPPLLTRCCHWPKRDCLKRNSL